MVQLKHRCARCMSVPLFSICIVMVAMLDTPESIVASESDQYRYRVDVAAGMLFAGVAKTRIDDTINKRLSLNPGIALAYTFFPWPTVGFGVSFDKWWIVRSSDSRAGGFLERYTGYVEAPLVRFGAIEVGGRAGVACSVWWIDEIKPTSYDYQGIGPGFIGVLAGRWWLGATALTVEVGGAFDAGVGRDWMATDRQGAGRHTVISGWVRLGVGFGFGRQAR